MVHPERLELPTHRFVADCSIPLSYGCIFLNDFLQGWIVAIPPIKRVAYNALATAVSFRPNMGRPWYW